ncbi:MAG TPA: DinB family protein, partial [Anaerolineales bacterium]
MNSAALLKIQFERIEREFKLVLKYLSLEQIHWQPAPEANSLGFLLWHLLYTWDEYAALIENR